MMTTTTTTFQWNQFSETQNYIFAWLHTAIRPIQTYKDYKTVRSRTNDKDDDNDDDDDNDSDDDNDDDDDDDEIKD